MYRALKASGAVSAEDDEPVFPASHQHLFSIFFDLHSTRPQTGFGMSAITYEAIDTYARLMHIELSPWEVRMIRRMDEVMLKANRVAGAGKMKTAGKGRK
jgi:hypothetical protein